LAFRDLGKFSLYASKKGRLRSTFVGIGAASATGRSATMKVDEKRIVIMYTKLQNKQKRVFKGKSLK
jgi:hypothetical protein